MYKYLLDKTILVYLQRDYNYAVCIVSAQKTTKKSCGNGGNPAKIHRLVPLILNQAVGAGTIFDTLHLAQHIVYPCTPALQNLSEIHLDTGAGV